MDANEIRRQLKWVRIIAIADGLLLVVLLIVAFGLDDDGLVSILGPIHGIGFLLLVFLVLRGAGNGLWGWWFPAVVVLTAGPPGSLYGDVRIRRELRGA